MQVTGAEASETVMIGDLEERDMVPRLHLA